MTTQNGAFLAIRNPMPAAGGVDPEEVEAVRRDAPQAFRTQKRAVTAADYAAAAERHYEVQDAFAQFRWTGSWRTVYVSADRFGGGPVDAPFKARLRRQLESVRMAGYDLEIVTPRFVPLDVRLHVCARSGYFRSDVLKRVGQVLSSGALPDGSLGLFHPDNLTFGAPVYLSRIIAAAQSVDGVDSVHAERFQRLVNPDPLSLESGVVAIGAAEIAQLANNRTFPERGRLVLTGEEANERPRTHLKRNVSPPVAGSECCDCCEGIEAETPQAIDNPVGLSRLGYRVGVMPGSARACTRRCRPRVRNAAGTVSPLASLLTRDDSDFTIGLIDAFACSAEVIAFYQERIAAESWLGTAVERVSVQEMGKLVGYELKPGLAAETALAFALETPPAPPAGLPPEPGNFVTGVPAALRLDAGLKVQSVPGPDEKPQTFELVERWTGASEWNASPAERSTPPRPGDGTWLQGPALAEARDGC